MNDFKVQRYTSNYKELWDEFVSKSKNATFLFYRDFMEYHQDRFEDFSLIIFHKNKIIALLPANKEKELVCSHRGLTYGGILLHENISFINYIYIVKNILFFLNKNHISKLEMKLIPSIYTTSLSEEIHSILHYANGSLFKKEISLAVPISGKLNFSKLRMRGVKLGIKNGIEIIESESIDEFWNEVLTPNLQKRHQTVPVHSLQEMNKLKRDFPNNIRQFNIIFENKIIGGTTIFETKNVAHTQYISGIKEYNYLGGLDLLFHYLITNTFKNKKYFNFGTSTIPNSTQINKGLFNWKQGFGAIPVTHDYILFDTNNFEKLDSVMV